MTFTVHCSGCSAAFPIDSAKVPFPGVYAECSDCSTVFLVRTPEEESLGHSAEPAYQAPSGVVESDSAHLSNEISAPAAPDAAPLDVAVAEPQPLEVQAPDPVIEPEPVVVEEPEPVLDPAPIEVQEAEAVLDPEPAAAPAPAPSASPFGRRDPNERARRLARVLVSDMIAYYPDRHRQSLQAGTLAKDFEEEIEKSWSEYVDQVGKDMADSTTYFKDALNDVLAEGREVF